MVYAVIINDIFIGHCNNFNFERINDFNYVDVNSPSFGMYNYPVLKGYRDILKLDVIVDNKNIENIKNEISENGEIPIGKNVILKIFDTKIDLMHEIVCLIESVFYNSNEEIHPFKCTTMINFTCNVFDFTTITEGKKVSIDNAIKQNYDNKIKEILDSTAKEFIKQIKKEYILPPIKKEEPKKEKLKRTIVL